MNSAYLKNALLAGILTGSFDISAAMLQFWLKTGRDPLFVPKYVASGALGKEATAGGAGMIMTGFLFHFIIALSFACFFFWLYARWPAMARYKILTGIGYGVFMSLIMQGIIVPLSRTSKAPYNVTNSIVAAIILMICIGIPLAFLADRAKRTTAVMAVA